MWCIACQHAVDHRQSVTAKVHLKGAKHVNNKKRQWSLVAAPGPPLKQADLLATLQKQSASQSVGDDLVAVNKPDLTASPPDSRKMSPGLIKTQPKRSAAKSQKIGNNIFLFL